MILTVTLNPCIDKTVYVDKLVCGELNIAGKVKTDVGGKGINVSKVLSTANIEQTATGICSDENDSVICYLKSINVPTAFAYSKKDIRTNMKIVDNSKKVTTEINEKGMALSSETADSFFGIMDKLYDKANIIVLSGSVPSSFDENAYKNIIAGAKKHNVKTILDADGELLKRGIEAIPYAIKPNLYEFEKLCNKTFTSNEEIVIAAREYIKRGIKLIVISLGAEGAVFVDENEAYFAKPFAIECKSTVCCGDSMVAVMAYAAQNGYSLYDIAKYSTCAGTITASKEGSEVCTFNEVEQNANRLEVKMIEI